MSCHPAVLMFQAHCPATMKAMLPTIGSSTPTDDAYVILQESLRLSRMTRFYIKQKEDPHGPHIAIYVSCLPTSLSQRQYEHILLDMIGRGQSPSLLSLMTRRCS